MRWGKRRVKTTALVWLPTEGRYSFEITWAHSSPSVATYTWRAV